MAFNKVILIGRLTTDPEFSQSASGVSVCKFNIAVDRSTSKGQEKQTDFFRVSTFRKTAEFVGRYFTKGKQILVEGKIQNNNYTDQSGVKHYSCEIIADSVGFVGDRESNNVSGNNGYQAMQTPQAQNAEASAFEEILSDGNVPF